MFRPLSSFGLTSLISSACVLLSLSACTPGNTTRLGDHLRQDVGFNSDTVRRVSWNQKSNLSHEDAHFAQLDSNLSSPQARNARSGPDQLNSKELMRLFAGKSALGRHNERAGEWTEYTAVDGRALYLNRFGEISDGQWWISGNQVCFSYGQQTSASCNLIQRVGSYYQYVQTNGQRDFYAIQFSNGDVANLIERAARIQ